MVLSSSSIESGHEDPVLELHLKGGGGEERLTTLSAGQRNTVKATVRPRKADHVLWARHQSGTQSRVLWGAPEEILGDVHSGAFVRRGDRETVVVGVPTPSVLVREVGSDEDSLVFRGTYFGTTERRVQLAGPRALSSLSAAVAPGDFDVSVPVREDCWGLGVSDLPEDRYRLVADGPDDPIVIGSGNLRQRPPVAVKAGSYHWKLGARQATGVCSAFPSLFPPTSGIHAPNGI